ncbi:MAG: 2-hydroxychromene-2-carboxylate isomerase [Inquilinaceae bacterium]
MARPIDFYFDFASPYGYLAATQIERIARAHGRSVVWRPILIGVAMKLTGGRPLVEVPLRADYTRRDVPRFARLLGVPLTMPAGFPEISLAGSRAVYWVADRDAGLASRLARALYDAHWGEGRSIKAPETVAELAAPLGIDAAALMAAVQTPEIKERLKTETAAALERGVFGSPFIFVDDEPFWGADRLDQVAMWLAGAGSATP